MQLHLVSPRAPYYQKKDVVLAADCTAYAVGDFHARFLKGRSLAIACPKLDTDKEAYVEKIAALVDEAEINTLTVVIMEVPCCGGLVMLTQEALKRAKRKIPLKKIVISLKGDTIQEEWVSA